ncbi:UDP:flavonoid glycosyltransferase YjiC (YdhE family) [Rhodococcus sp. 27YEA15]|uniref:glycosyltransferase n=1 Tax=Rhodococcus sp. 27YEA15 TaxID=3156259 RepID=UPI003C7A021C
MRIVFAFNGTRGDVQPAAVIGAELRRRGHHVVFGSPPNLLEFASRLRLDSRSFGYDTRAHMNSDLVRVRARTGSLLQRLRALTEIRDFGWAQIVGEMREICADADAIVTGFTTEQVAFNFAEAQGVPFVTLHHAPVVANRYVSPVPGAALALPHWLNRMSWAVFDRVFWRLTRARENRLRSELGLAPATKPLPERIVESGGIQIQAYDQTFVPELGTEWGEKRPFVGFLDLDAEQRHDIGEDRDLDPGVASWIEDGTPPVYFGFGSMPVPDPAALTSVIADVCDDLGVRALVSAGWNDFDARRYPHVKLVGSVDHSRILPRCRAAVHHGGAGTTAAGIRAGCPTMICSVGSDQPFWGAQLTRIGIGVTTPLRGLDSVRLRSGLSGILDEDCRHRVREFGATLTTSAAAVSAAADVIEFRAAAGKVNRDATAAPKVVT